VKNEEKQVALSEFEKNGLPPDGYSISVKTTGAIVKHQMSKKADKALEVLILVHITFQLRKIKKHFIMYNK
jgi:hypothetical protein